MANLLSSVSQATNTAGFINTIINKAIVKPKDLTGVDGFFFDIEDENSIELTSDITDHFVEDNTAINDHIALHPEIVTVHAFVGELANTPPPGMEFLRDLTDRLAALAPYLPNFVTQAQQIYNQIEQTVKQATKLLNSAKTLYNVYKKKSINNPQDKQTYAYNFFYSLWQSRALFSVKTPWGNFTDMAILNMRAYQSPDSKYMTDFSITFKKIRFAETITTNPVQAGRLVIQNSTVSDKGRTKGQLRSLLAIEFFPKG
jgi:hypothetical protein